MEYRTAGIILGLTFLVYLLPSIFMNILWLMGLIITYILLGLAKLLTVWLYVIPIICIFVFYQLAKADDNDDPQISSARNNIDQHLGSLEEHLASLEHNLEVNVNTLKEKIDQQKESVIDNWEQNVEQNADAAHTTVDNVKVGLIEGLEASRSNASNQRERERVESRADIDSDEERE